MMQRHFVNLLSLGLLLLIGCSASEDTRALKEIPTTEALLHEASELQLLEYGKRLFAGGQYRFARQYFESLLDGYPQSPYREFVLIKIGDSYYESKEYEEASRHFAQFLNDYPASMNRPYALYQSGRSYEMSHGGIGRDPTPLHEAKKLYNQTQKDFPHSIYAALAAERVVKVEKKILGGKKLIMDYYQAQEKMPAFEARKAEYTNALEDLETLKETANVNKETALSDTAPKPTRYEVVRNVPEVQKKETKSTRTVQGAKTDEPLLTAARCVGDAILLSYTHTSTVDLSTVEAELPATQISLPLASGLVSELRCESGEKIKISQAGTVVLESRTISSVIALENPKRILLGLSEQSS